MKELYIPVEKQTLKQLKNSRDRLMESGAWSFEKDELLHELTRLIKEKEAAAAAKAERWLAVPESVKIRSLLNELARRHAGVDTDAVVALQDRLARAENAEFCMSIDLTGRREK